MEREGPGVVVDSVALIGARVARLLRFNQAHWRRQIELRQPDLLVFWLGGNNATSRGWTRDAFVRDYGQAIGNARRGRPEASCLVISVTDIGERETGETRPHLPDLVDAQRQVALAQGCAFFDIFHAMGGPGTIRRWVNGSPRLGTPDHRHLTPAGSDRVGQLIHEALLEAYRGQE
jgi:lysophospholipase L1-like esterase